MSLPLHVVGPPAAGAIRVGWHSDPLGPPPWSNALPDGTFGNRFDDPSAADGIPPEDRFQCVYAGTTAEAAFGETLDQFRVSIDQLNLIASMVEDVESVEALFGDVFDLEDPSVPARGIVWARWREERRLVTAHLDPSLRFADLASPASLQHLQYHLPAAAARAGLRSADFPAVMDRTNRAFTQACSRYVYDLRDAAEATLFHGIRYLSRLDPVAWECWALFVDRIEGSLASGFPEPIAATHPALCSVARMFDLSIKLFEGSRPFYRP
ncbi:MAG: RES domain-containing protein [Chloroflexota bacterium]|nr:RES domain-containing protein [Chloroflexota bacterium]